MSRVALRCQSCRHHVLDSFASLAGLSIRPLPQARATRSPIPWIQQQQTPRKTFSTCIRHYEVPKPQESSEENRTEDSIENSTGTSSQSDTSQVPWYLQVSNPEPPAPVSPLLAIQELPPIPPNAPPILSPALEYLSVHMGLDNLSLLDLRGVDPPPALGANLIMILGTARSYKHLNTCADRFCRWLRSKYKLTPYADGLLGRNELKLRLRRKARRMKLAQSVGNTTMAERGQDDGITTGWICVNAGTVEDAEVDGAEPSHEEQGDESRTATDQEEIGTDEEEYTNPADNYIGFGNRSMAPRIVVQMFVEEKRVEMDLEGLWNHRLLRKVDKAEKAAIEASQAVFEADVESEPTNESEPDSAGARGTRDQFRPFGSATGR